MIISSAYQPCVQVCTWEVAHDTVCRCRVHLLSQQRRTAGNLASKAFAFPGYRARVFTYAYRLYRIRLYR